APNSIGDPPMGITAENLVKKYNITRKEQDQFALESQQKMNNAIKEGRFKQQIVPIDINTQSGKGNKSFYIDEHPRPSSTIEGLSQLPPVFLENGTVTAGNSSGLNDAASALMITSKQKAKELGFKDFVTIRDCALSGVDPNIMGIGPVPAVKKVLKKSGLSLDDMDIIEINEAFAGQVLACNRELNMDMRKVNVNGGAIAHGHPLGATGAIL